MGFNNCYYHGSRTIVGRMEAMVHYVMADDAPDADQMRRNVTQLH